MTGHDWPPPLGGNDGAEEVRARRHALVELGYDFEADADVYQVDEDGYLVTGWRFGDEVMLFGHEQWFSRRLANRGGWVGRDVARELLAHKKGWQP